MSYRIVAGLALLLVPLAAEATAPKNIAAKKLSIKDHSSDPAKRQIQVQSTDAAVLYTDAVDPAGTGASVRVYSASDNQCFLFEDGPEWSDTGKSWKYKDDSKNQIQIGDGKLQVKIRSGITFDLADDFPQDAVNVQVQVGFTGVRFCLRCSAPTKDEEFKFQAKDCVAATCDAEPPGCYPGATTTTSTSTTTTTLPPVEVMGALPRTSGKFNYAMMPGVAGADTQCEADFPGTHACSHAELVAGEAAGDLVGIQDTTSVAVTSFWCIDAATPANRQCNDALIGGSGLNWDYQTAHTGGGGDFVTLTNASGVLGTLNTSNLACSQQKWVGCCKD